MTAMKIKYRAMLIGTRTRPNSKPQPLRSNWTRRMNL